MGKGGRALAKKKVDRKERMDEIQQKLVQGTLDIFNSDKFADYISAMAKFPSYSINNCILIVSQCPTATHVCGFRKWQTDFNRTVNKNEHGIMILAPMKFKTEVDEPAVDTNNHPLFNSDGTRKMETVEKEVSSFRPCYVFDVQQTSGDPLPSLVSMLDSGVEDFPVIKEALMNASPVPISFEAISGSANGYYSPKEQKIVVRGDMPELQTIKTMLHEISHATLGHGSEEDKWDRETKEVQAEAVAYWVSSLLNIGDTSDYSFGYISGWSKDREVTELKENLELIKSTAESISANLEKQLTELMDAKENREKDPDQAENSKRKKSR